MGFKVRKFDKNISMKVLHVSYGGLGNGGVASVILSIVFSLHSKFDFGCVVFNHKGERENEFIKYGRLYRVNCYLKKSKAAKILDILLRPYRMTYAAYSICKKEKYDVIHCHNGYEEIYFLLGAKIAGVHTRIAHSHNSQSPNKPSVVRRIFNSLCRIGINKLSTERIGCSQKACDDFFRIKDTKVIYNSINLSAFYWKRNKHENLQIVHVGRYDYQKNQSFVIDVFDCIRKQIPNAKLKLVGFGPDEINLKNKIKKLGLVGFVSLVDGRAANIHEAYADSDLMIFPSFYEGFGIVLIEAQSTGCYVFASDVVPNCTNVGMMTTLSLTLSADEWANRIVYFISETHHFNESSIARIKQFDNAYISEKYKQLYEGK